MITTRIDSDGAIPVLFYRRADGSWADALDWSKYARLRRPAVYVDGLGNRSVLIGALSPPDDSIRFGISADGQIDLSREERFNVWHDGVDATDEVRHALSGGDISKEARDVVERAQAHAAGGNYAEVGFDLLLLPFYVAGRAHFEDLKERHRRRQTVRGTH